MKHEIIISPKTKVGELLDNFPQLESVLINMSPSFAKLKNPILRKTVARVATLQQIAAVGGLSVDELVNELRQEAGQSLLLTDDTGSDYSQSKSPDWFDQSKVTTVFDAAPVINSGGSPLNEILARTNKLIPGEIYELHSPFLPAPVIDMLKSNGFTVYTNQTDKDFITFVTKLQVGQTS